MQLIAQASTLRNQKTSHSCRDVRLSDSCQTEQSLFSLRGMATGVCTGVDSDSRMESIPYPHSAGLHANHSHLLASAYQGTCSLTCWASISRARR
eukprot:1140718-Pelagomonas_calceolata.AAC.6